MASRDPFNDVLKALGLYDDIQESPSAEIETQGMAPNISCRVQVMDEDRNLTTIQQAPSAVRIIWALKLIKFLHPTPEAAIQIRPMNLIMLLDGTVKAGPVLVGNSINLYPDQYRIPTSTIMDLPLQEQVWRAEKFALGTLLYEIFTGHTPFEGLNDEVVQDNDSLEAEFPHDLDLIQPLCLQSLIYACWSPEFGRYITLGKFQQYVLDNPVQFTLQVASVVVGTAALITVPILGAIGFGALGPVARSAAAAWQASIGAVEAGSLFAICQGAAMGGAAATGLAVTGATSGAVAMAASVVPGASNLRSIFIQKFRKRV